MINPVRSAHAHGHASQVSQPATRQPQPKQPSSEVHDKVTLKSTRKSAGTGDADHDGDSR
jgi:hypothetical protein